MTTTSSLLTEEYYYPDGLIPVSPQARQFGYVMDTYVTGHVWSHYCVWSSGRGATTDKRIFELLSSCFTGLGKALTVADDRIQFDFKHFYLRKNKKAKKRGAAKLGARLMLHPDTGVPWLLIFHPDFDFADQLKKGEPPNVQDSDENSSGLPAVEPG